MTTHEKINEAAKTYADQYFKDKSQGVWEKIEESICSLEREAFLEGANFLLPMLEAEQAKVARLKEAVKFYADSCHLNESDSDIVERECEGSRMTEHIFGKTARKALAEVEK